MITVDDCLFCKILAGEIPAEVVDHDEHTLAFRDISPQAPTHVPSTQSLTSTSTCSADDR